MKFTTLCYCCALVTALAGQVPAQQSPSSGYVEALVKRASALRRADSLPDAVATLQTAIDYARNQPAPDSAQLADLYYRRGYYLVSANRFESGLKNYRQARAWARHPATLGKIHNATGTLYSRMARFDAARQHLLTAIDLRKQAYDEYSDPVAMSMANLGVVELNDGNMAIADSLQRKALEIRKSIPGLSRAKIGKVLVNLGDVYMENGAAETALGHYDAALGYFDEENAREIPSLAQLYQSIGDALIATGADAKAYGYFRAAQRLLDRSLGKRHRTRGQLFVSMADGHMAREKYDSALAYYHHGLLQFMPDYDDPDPLHQPEPALFEQEPWVFVALAGKADAFSRMAPREDFEQIPAVHASRHFRLAFDYADHVRQQYVDVNAKAFFSEFSYPTFESALRMHFDTEGELREQVFPLMERSKTNAVLEAFVALQSKGIASLPDEVFFEGQGLQRHLAAQQRKAIRDSSAAVRAALLEAHQALQDFRQGLARQHPSYYALSTQLPIPDTADLQELLPHPDAMLVEYFWGDSSIFVLSATQRGYALHAVADVPGVQTQVRGLRQAISRSPVGIDGRESYKALTAPAHGLYQQLLAPAVRHHFPPGELPTQLRVVPDGPLSFLPFECLLTAAPAGDYSYLTLPYLVHSTALSYGHSVANLLASQRMRRRRPLPGVLALAPERSDMSPLPNAAAEVRQAVAALGGKALFGAEANASNLRSQGHYSVLHLAAHARSDDRNPLESGIYLFPEDSTDGRLHAWQLYDAALHTDLVILSACQTGTGQARRGEGVMSMARGFRIAGCPSVIMSLWLVPDASAAELMAHLYAHLSDGRALDAAFQAARQDYLVSVDNIKAHPYFWATSVLVGNPDTVLGTAHPAFWLLIVLGFLLGGGLICFGLAFFHTRGRNN